MRDISVSDIHKKCIEGFHSQMQIYYDNGKRLRKKTSSAPTGLVWDTNMAAVSLFLDINMADVTSYQSYHKKALSHRLNCCEFFYHFWFLVLLLVSYCNCKKCWENKII